MASEDDELMVRLQAGESRAFDELVGRHQDALVGFFRRNSRDQQLAEDLAQETLLRVYNQAWDYLPLGRFRSWMFRIARNLLIDAVRRQSHDALVKAVRAKSNNENEVLVRIAGDVASPLERAQFRELARLVDGFLDEIPEEQRLTFTLHHFGGLTLAEVAEVMESSLSTTKSRLRLAREKLQEKLQRHGISAPQEMSVAPDG